MLFRLLINVKNYDFISLFYLGLETTGFLFHIFYMCCTIIIQYVFLIFHYML